MGHTEHPQNRPWVSIDYLCDGMLANLVGAASKDEVGMMNSLSVNLHLLLGMFYRPKIGKKYKILMERNAFPSDHYVVQSCVQVAAALQQSHQGDDAILFLPGTDPLASEVAALVSHGAVIPDTTLYVTAEILAFIDKHAESIALILLPGVQYLTGQSFDIESITRKAHEHVSKN